MMFDRNRNLELRLVTIYVIEGKAYLPTKDRYESGQTIDKEPVHVVNLEASALEEAMGRVLDDQQLRLQEPEEFEALYSHGSAAVLGATNMKSWKELAASGPAYIIDWTDERINIAMSDLDDRGRYIYPRSRILSFPPETELRALAKAVLDDIGLNSENYQ